MTRPGSATARGYGAEWQRLRLVVLDRDGRVCRWCGRYADTVDHVVALADGGARLDPANLVACCRPCNSRRGAEVASRRARDRAHGLAPGSGSSSRARPRIFGRGSTLDPAAVRVLSPRAGRPGPAVSRS